MKVTTTRVYNLSAKETGDILCQHIAEKQSIDLGKVKTGVAKDLDGLAAEVTLVMESEETAK